MALPGSRRHTDHSADAGGDPGLLDAKRALREEVWDALVTAEATRFPGAHGRIPNFRGAEAAADRLQSVDAWRAAATVKANPDSPQWPVRQRALADGLLVYMAAPRLAAEDPFFVLDPATLEATPRAASSIKGAGRHGRPVSLEEVEPVDLVVTGCVAVDRTGVRLGKGGGFADLEFAVASAAGLIGSHTLVVTTVHPVQVLDAGRIPVAEHDVGLDLVVTPDEVITCARERPQPSGIDWASLTEQKISAIPLLTALREEQG